MMKMSRKRERKQVKVTQVKDKNKCISCHIQVPQFELGPKNVQK